MMNKIPVFVVVYTEKKQKQVYRPAGRKVWAQKRRMMEEMMESRKISATAEMMRPGDARKRA
jgi:hypothetical protein